MSQSPLTIALTRALRPLVRLGMARGMAFPEFAELLKRLAVEEAESLATREGGKITDSRISLLTGLQRRDVKALRETPAAQTPSGMGLLPRILARWEAAAPYASKAGKPKPLPRAGNASFDELVSAVSRDMHPRSAFDALIRLGLIEQNPAGKIMRTSRAFVPSDEAALLAYAGANLGDHAEAIAANVLGADHAPYFERAVHYNGLTAESVATLETLARRRQEECLAELNAAALKLQRSDSKDATAPHRIRVGTYIYRASNEPAPGEST